MNDRRLLELVCRLSDRVVSVSKICLRYGSHSSQHLSHLSCSVVGSEEGSEVGSEVGCRVGALVGCLVGGL